MTLRVAVDFGTSSTCVVASVNGRDPQVVVVDGQPLLGSAVYAAPDGTLFVGQEAERQAAMDPSRYEPHPKRRIDEGELLLGDTVLRVTDVVHAVLGRALAEARRLAGGAEVDLLVLTHPADWGAVRTRLLRQAAGRLAHEVALVPEPVAAAVFHAATFTPTEVAQDRTVHFSGQPGDTLAVLDVGGGTVDVSVVRRMPGPQSSRGGFQVLATRGDPSFGGADIDQALLEHVGSLVSAEHRDSWRQLVEGRELADRRRRRVLRQDVRGAKETLSRHTYTDVPMPPPFADAHVTREDLERLIAAPLGRAVELTASAIDEAGMKPQQLTAIFLVGGSSRIPMVSRLVYERTGVVPTTLDQPETVVARGALRAVQVDPDRSGALPGSSAGRPREQRTEVVGPGAMPRRGFPPPGGPPGPTVMMRRPEQDPRGQPAAPRGQRPPPPPAPPQPRTPPRGEPAPRKRKRLLMLLIGGAALVVVGALVAVLTLTGDDEPQAPQGRTFAQYDFTFVAPADWTQTADNVRARQVVIKPADAQNADNLVVVQEFVLPYDGAADRARLVRELRVQIDREGQRFADFNPEAQFASRQVIYYRENKQNLSVAWYVIASGTSQVSVGCQTVLGQPDRVAKACEQVVRTLTITK